MPRKTHGQHFLLSAKARSLSLRDVMRMTDEEAMTMFRAIRWASTEGEPVCPECGCLGCYEYASRPIFKCKGCAEWGQHHHIGALYLGRYAAEMAWREDHRRQSNGGQVTRLLGLALAQPVSVDWSGYWQRGR